MRLVPVLTALVVGMILYLFIMERDWLRSVAGAQPVTEAAAAAPGDATQPDLATISVVAMRSEARRIESGVVLRGRTEATRRVEIRAETGGLVISPPLRKGAEVAAGEVLCRLDPGSRPAQLAEAEARLLEAEANDRASSELAERGFAAETTAFARRAALQSAQAQVQQALLEISRLEMQTPFDGLLETDTAELGSLLQPGSLCATVIDLDPIRLVGFVPEQDVERLAVDATVGARLVTGQQIVGKVVFVSRSADPTTRTFRVEAEVPNVDRTIRDGISAEIYVSLDGETAHLLPMSALTLDDAGRLGIRAAVDGEARFMPVTILRDDPQGVLVGGLPEQIDVIVVGQDYVTDGQPVSVTYRERNTQ